MQLRKATDQDVPAIAELFGNTIRKVNKHDYSPAQIEAWAAGSSWENRWRERFSQQVFIVAENDTELLGFGSMAKDGYLDFMYVHADYQGQGIASAILEGLEQVARDQQNASIYVSVSITARPFFLKRGYHKEQELELDINGLEFINWKMRKHL